MYTVATCSYIIPGKARPREPVIYFLNANGTPVLRKRRVARFANLWGIVMLGALSQWAFRDAVRDAVRRPVLRHAVLEWYTPFEYHGDKTHNRWGLSWFTDRSFASSLRLRYSLYIDHVVKMRWACSARARYVWSHHLAICSFFQLNSCLSALPYGTLIHLLLTVAVIIFVFVIRECCCYD